ncbi:putative transporter C5D6.04 [Choanephora cucurbitarum]|uniref:Putative transporter C5D6.04 n=1 Tax=Choanephora cucurbitarum TaxID=101091 RepID=A0A1C7NNU7_9FUNG|nr:putative transporter C5D6.04 [Choanephora cucurbitarum]
MLELILASLQVDYAFVVAFCISIIQVMVIVFIGAVLSKLGYMDNDKQKWLSKLNLTFFTPCLLFSNIASVISVERLIDFWSIPVFYVLFVSISWTLSYIACSLFRVENHHKRFVSACVMFSNANSLPVAIIASLAVSEAGKKLYWDSDDSQSSISARGISYVLFFGLFGNILRWSYGYNLLQQKNEEEDNSSVETLRNSQDEESALSERFNRQCYGSTSSSSSGSHDTMVSDHSAKLSDASVSLKSRLLKLLQSIQQCMSPPLYAALLALFVGLIPSVKHVFYKGFLHQSFTRAIDSCGKVSVPLVLVCLGAQLKHIQETQPSQDKRYRKPVFLSIFVRMILVPLCVLPLVFSFHKWGGVFSKLAEDPIFIVSMVIVGCTPTAINLAQITQVNGAFEQEMLSVLFWSYGIFCIPICTLVVFLALWMVST